MDKDYGDMANDALIEAREYANSHAAAVPVETFVYILLFKALVFSLLNIATYIWEAADKLMFSRRD